VPLFEALSLDEEYVVRQHLGEQMEPIARTCYNTSVTSSTSSKTSTASTATQQHAQGGGYRLIIEVCYSLYTVNYTVCCIVKYVTMYQLLSMRSI
jgi:hypothetical protein